MSEEDEDGNDEIQQSIKKKLNFLMRTVAGYKLERIEREAELKETQAPAGTHRGTCEMDLRDTVTRCNVRDRHTGRREE